MNRGRRKIPPMEGHPHVTDNMLSLCPLDEETRDGCNVCAEEILDEDKLHGPPWTEERTPKFLEDEAVLKRVDFEYQTTYKAWREFVQNCGKYPSVQEVKSLRESVADISEKIKAEQKGSFKESQSAQPKEQGLAETGPVLKKSFPLTLESRKKRIERTTVLKKEEKRTALESVRKKQEELRKLKDEYNKVSKQIQCTQKEKKAEYERKKEEYLERLSKEKNLDINVLRRRGDDIFKTYVQESTLAKKMMQKKAAEREEAVRKVEKEREDRVIEPIFVRPKHSPKNESWEKQNVEEVFRNAQEALREDSMTQYTKAFLSNVSVRAQAESEPFLKTHEGTTKTQSQFKYKKGSSFSRKKKISVSQKSQTKKRGTFLKPVSQKKKQNKKSKSGGGSHYRSLAIPAIYPSCEELKAEPCGLDWDLKSARRRARLYSRRSSLQADGKPPLVLDERVAVSPKKVYFRNFYPAETKTAIVKVFNTSLNKIYIQHSEVVLEPRQDSKMIQVWPPDIVKLLPGNCKVFELNFSSVLWTDQEEFSGEVRFRTRSPPNTKDVRYVSVGVECTRAKTDPVILEREIHFVEEDNCINRPQTKYLTIDNRGIMECRVYVQRCFDIQETVPEMKRRPTPFELSGRFQTGKKQSKLTKRGSNNSGAIAYIIDYLIESAVSPFRTSLTRGWILRSMTRTAVPIKFQPHLLEEFSAAHSLKVQFESNYGFEKEETVNLYGMRATPVLDVVPAVMDMKTLIVGSRGNQFVFTLKNVSKKFQTVKCKLPKLLAKHFILEPTSTLLRPQADAQFIVRSNLGWSFFEDAEDYLTEVCTVVEFEIDILPENHLPLKLVVLGTVAHPLGLSITPNSIDFGDVLTTETVCEDFVLTNHSMMEHQVAFFNLPEWGVIMPGYGIVKIGPCQSLKLQFQYSPTYVQAGGAGMRAVHTFEIKCSTVRMLSTLNCPKPFPIVETIERIHDDVEISEMTPDRLSPKNNRKLREIEENMFGILFDGPSLLKMDELAEEEEGESDCGISFLDEGLQEFDVESVQPPGLQKKRLISSEQNTTSRRSVSSIGSLAMKRQSSTLRSIRRRTKSKGPGQLFDELKVDVSSQYDWCAANMEDLDRPYVTLKGNAHVSDPLCELSDLRVIFPATPVTSFSVVSIYLSCPSDIKSRIDDCATTLRPEFDTRPKANAQFEFSSSSECLQIEPAAGTISHGEKITIHLIFKPTISEKKLQKAMSSEKKKSQKLKKYSNVGNYNEEVANYNMNKLDLLRGVKNEVLRICIKCLVDITMEEMPNVKRTEVLHCLACCPIIPPDFVIWTSVKQIIPLLEFPITATGMKSKLTVDILNNTWENIYLRKSVVDLSGTFYTTLVPTESSSLPHNLNKGVILPPEAYVRFEVVYAPSKPGMHVESIQFSANNTVVECKLSGSAVIPVYNIYPTFKLLKLESEKQKVEETVKVENKGNASLAFYVNSCFEREIYNSAFMTASTLDYSKQIQKSMIKMQEMDLMVKHLINNYSVESHKSRILIEPKKLVLKPGGAGEFKISFKPPSLPKTSIFLNDEESMESEEDGPEEYVKRVKITLGTSSVVADWTILGIVSQKLTETFKRKSKIG